MKTVEDVNDMNAIEHLKQGGQMDMTYQGELKDTAMWNPLHFAVYGGHFEVVKVLVEQFKVNVGKTAPKSFALNEGDQVNDQRNYIEDTVFLLQMALVKGHSDIFGYLLEAFNQFWPSTLFHDWF